jgi:hypothetical protein
MISEPPVDTTAPPQSQTIDPQVNYSAQICHVNAWTTPVGYGAATRIAVAPLAHGAAVFAVPQQGGPLTGFELDQYGLIQGDPAGQVIRKGDFRTVHAGRVDGRIVTAVSDGHNVLVDAIADDLSQTAKLAALQGRFSAASMPITNARELRVLPTASDTGLTYSTFDKQWQETHSVAAFHADETTAIDAAQLTFGASSDTLVAWSTPDSCNVERLIAAKGWSDAEPCGSPRVTSTGGAHAMMLFERHGKIGSYNLNGNPDDLKTVQYFPEPGTSPRAAFDGSRTWIAYLDVKGELAAGFLDPQGNVVRTSIEQQPGHDAFELAMVDGHPTVFTSTETGFYAFEICAVAQGTATE